MDRRLLIFLDKTLFRVLFYLVVLVERLRRTKVESALRLNELPRILVIRPGGLGDALMSVPFLRALKKAYPSSHVTVVCVKRNQPALEQLPFHDDLIIVDTLPRLVENLRTLRRGRYDMLFDLEAFRRTSSVIAWISGAQVRVGFDTNSRRHLYTHLVTYAGDRCFEAANMLRQLRVFDIDVSADSALDMRISLPEAHRLAAPAMLAEFGLDPRRGVLVAVAVGIMKPHHEWVMSEFAALIELIRTDDDVRIILVGAPSDRDSVDEVLGYLDGDEHIVDLVGRTDVPQVLGLLESCRILVSCDGGLVLMAAAMGCATVSIWGPGVMERYKPPGEQHVGVRKDYACIPCVTWDRLGEFPPCPYNRRCLNDLKATDVFAAYKALKRQLESDARSTSMCDASSD